MHLSSAKLSLRLALACSLSALQLGSGTGPALSADAPAPSASVDALQSLYSAQFYGAVNGEWLCPYGSLKLSEGSVAVIGKQRGSALLLGGLQLRLDQLPAGAGSLNLFDKITAQLNGGRPEVLSLSGPAAFMSASIDSGIHEASGRKLDGGRGWDALSPAEQEQFKSYFLQVYSDGFMDEASLSPRPATGKELYIALWSKPAWEESQVRYDFKVDAQASSISIEDYYRGTMMYQWPWAPEKDEGDPGLKFSQLDYRYSFEPSSDPAAGTGGKLKYTIDASFSVDSWRTAVSFASAPWLGQPAVTDEQGSALKVERGTKGESPWKLKVTSQFEPDKPRKLHFSGECAVPQDYAGPGYAGVYRFDTSPLWPGEDQPVDVSIAVSLSGGNWNIVSSKATRVDADGGGSTYRWEQSTRNCMVVATRFPSREVKTDWGTLTVYAPPDLSDSVSEMGSVKAIGPVLAYYGKQWGPRLDQRFKDEGVRINDQTVFLIPGESGVQAFEDAGLVFILGGEESYGGSGQSLPVMAHELAHLWWGHGLSGPRWFVEGMANYGAAKFLEQYYGPGGAAEGQGEAVGYRRYMVNFALSHALPLSIEERDSLDDSGAIYHNSAGFLLTADQRVRGGLDPLLALLYAQHEYAPRLDHRALRGEFARLDLGLSGLWDEYVERGEIERSGIEDPTYRECVITPEREKYVLLLRWLVPMRRKAGMGDLQGAIYCAEQALDYRSEPKDYLYLAELRFKSGDLAGAKAILDGGQAGSGSESVDGVKAAWLSARVLRGLGDSVGELAALKIVAEQGAAFGLLTEVEAAQARLKELGAQ